MSNWFIRNPFRWISNRRRIDHRVSAYAKSQGCAFIEPDILTEVQPNPTSAGNGDGAEVTRDHVLSRAGLLDERIVERLLPRVGGRGVLWVPLDPDQPLTGRSVLESFDQAVA